MKRFPAYVGLLSLVSCSGVIGESAPVSDTPDTPSPTNGEAGGATGGMPSVACAGVSPSPGPSPLRRLNRREYNNTVRDLLGDATEPANTFPLEERVLGFDNNADLLTASSALIGQYNQAAEQIAARAVSSTNYASLVPCNPVTAGEDACARSFISTFGRRAFRRPMTVTADETAPYVAVYLKGREGADFKSGIQLVIRAMLQSPKFLYRLELSPAGAPAEVSAVGSFELACRLSYFLWGSMPDEPLFTAAESGRLRTKEGVAEQARRLLRDPRARAAVTAFHRQWLLIDRLDSVGKIASVFPGYGPEFLPLFENETKAFLDHVMWSGDGKVDTLLLAPFTFANKKLADFYGLLGPAGAGFEKVAVNPAQRAGVLTQGGLLSILAKSNQASPVRRGLFVREQMFCGEVPPPPDDANVVVPEPSKTATTRERFAQHTVSPACGGCHRLLDTLGFGFENFNGVGQWRTTENAKTIDASGEVVGTDVPGPFRGVADLAQKMARSSEVKSCVLSQWFRYAHGRAETAADGCTVEALRRQFAASGYDVRELLVALTQTDAFLYRKVGS